MKFHTWARSRKIAGQKIATFSMAHLARQRSQSRVTRSCRCHTTARPRAAPAAAAPRQSHFLCSGPQPWTNTCCHSRCTRAWPCGERQSPPGLRSRLRSGSCFFHARRSGSPCSSFALHIAMRRQAARMLCAASRSGLQGRWLTIAEAPHKQRGWWR